MVATLLLFVFTLSLSNSSQCSDADCLVLMTPPSWKSQCRDVIVQIRRCCKFFFFNGFVLFLSCWKRRRISIIETGFSSSGEEDEEVVYLYMDTFSRKLMDNLYNIIQ